MASKDQPRDPGRDNNQSNVYRKRAERRPEIVKRRREQRRREFEKQRRNWMIIRSISIVAVLAILLAAGWWGFRQYQEYEVTKDVTTYFTLDDYSINHVEGEVLYEQIPPVGGPHNSIWQSCGYYPEPVYNWHAVHSMEHGAVWVTYDPDLPEQDIEKLKELGNQSYVLVSPYPGIDAPVVASVWGKQLTFDGVDDDRLDPFIREYRRNPSNTPEPGALCSLGAEFTMEDGGTPQTEPSIISGTLPEVAAAEATATAEAGGSPAAPTEAPAIVEASPGATPAASPAAGPMASPVPSSGEGTPAATPE
jgi:hypothetical protein